MENQWLKQNNAKVQGIKKILVEYSFQSTQELPATNILATLESSIIEINRLQRELDKVTQKLAEAKKAAPSLTIKEKE